MPWTKQAATITISSGVFVQLAHGFKIAGIGKINVFYIYAHLLHVLLPAFKASNGFFFIELGYRYVKSLLNSLAVSIPLSLKR